jgi:hypothetical protein
MERPPKPNAASPVPTTRIALFVVVSALLVLAAVAFNRGAAGPRVGQGPAGGPAKAAQTEELTARLAEVEAEVEAAARPFLTAFFRYEVGELTPTVRATLLKTTAPEFGRQLLVSPPRRPPAGSYPPRAELGRVDATLLSPELTLAVVDGNATRAGYAQEFGFAFTLENGRWLASGVAQ